MWSNQFTLINPTKSYKYSWDRRSGQCALQLSWDSWTEYWQMNSLQIKDCEVGKNCVKVSLFVLNIIVAWLSRYDSTGYHCHTGYNFTSLSSRSHFTYHVWFLFLTISIHKMTTRFYFVCIFLLLEWKWNVPSLTRLSVFIPKGKICWRDKMCYSFAF